MLFRSARRTDDEGREARERVAEDRRGREDETDSEVPESVHGEAETGTRQDDGSARVRVETNDPRIAELGTRTYSATGVLSLACWRNDPFQNERLLRRMSSER